MIDTKFNVHEQIRNAYRRMAAEAHYRPAAPSDGMGTITVPLETLDLEAEASVYAAQWHRDEERGMADMIGYPDFGDLAVLVFTVEAARCLCGMEPEIAAVLLRMAADELEGRVRGRRA